jgi:hypothetical protein
VDELSGDEVSQAEKRPGHDHKPDHDPGRLHYLAAVWPLYPLQLSPASLEEVHEPRPWPASRSGGGGRDGTRPRTEIVLIAEILTRVSVDAVSTGTAVRKRLVGELGAADRELGLGQLDIGRGVLKGLGRVLEGIGRVLEGVWRLVALT